MLVLFCLGFVLEKILRKCNHTCFQDSSRSGPLPKVVKIAGNIMKFLKFKHPENSYWVPNNLFKIMDREKHTKDPLCNIPIYCPRFFTGLHRKRYLMLIRLAS